MLVFNVPPACSPPPPVGEKIKETLGKPFHLPLLLLGLAPLRKCHYPWILKRTSKPKEENHHSIHVGKGKMKTKERPDRKHYSCPSKITDISKHCLLC